jgi:hypothetical protein
VASSPYERYCSTLPWREFVAEVVLRYQTQ